MKRRGFLLSLIGAATVRPRAQARLMVPKVKSISGPVRPLAEDEDFLECRQFTAEEIARIFQVPVRVLRPLV